MSALCDWAIAVVGIPASGKRVERTATAGEREGLAKELNILACHEVSCDIRLRALRDGRYRVSGTIRATVAQACVVTLEPVDGVIEEQLDVEFWPAEQIPILKSTDQEEWFDPESADGAEPIEHGRIDLGRLIFETVSAALDPYPRKAGAALEWHEPPEVKAQVHPFAALAKLKPKS